MLVTSAARAARIWRSVHLFPIAYLLLTQATALLLIAVGVLGQSEFAADIALVHGATVATFYALSGNARNLILSSANPVSAAAIFRARLLLVLPLGATALAFSIGVTQVDALFSIVLVMRRAIEWLAELSLSREELVGNVRVAQRTVVEQATLLLGTVVAFAIAPEHKAWIALPWAVSPALAIAPRLLDFDAARFAPAARLFPHFGATAVSGLSIYIFRAMLVLAAGKALAGDLFAAFAIGSFAATLFANVLGPSMSLYEERTGKPYFPRAAVAAVGIYVCAGILALAIAVAAHRSGAFAGKPPLFWLAVSLSLFGGSLMLAAQRIRLRLIAAGRDREIFGVEVVMNVCLLAAIPLFNVLQAEAGLASLYLLNAGLLLTLYWTTESGKTQTVRRDHLRWITAALSFAVFFPLFFQLSGQVFNPAAPVFDSGGVLRTLPIPISILACMAGLVLLARFAAAAGAFWTILGLMAAMLVSTVVTADAETTERTKLLLILQFLIPVFGLVLGAMFARPAIALRAALAVVGVIVPAQLLVSWAQGKFALSHTLFLFGIYQHQQYVPVIMVAAFAVSLPIAWEGVLWRGRLALSGLCALVGIYAVAAYSIVAMLAFVVAVLVFFVGQSSRGKEGRWFAGTVVGMSVLVLVGYNYLIADSYTWWQKLGSLLDIHNVSPRIVWKSDFARPDGAGWRIKANAPTGTWLLQIDRLNSTSDLVLKGVLSNGAMGVTSAGVTAQKERPTIIDHPGAFEVRIAPLPGKGNVVLYQHGPAVDVTFAAHWDASSPSTMKNLSERLGDWRLFGGGMLESPQAFFFGHDKPIPRDVRTSAHNFYLDVGYNFGAVALLPLLALIYYTGTLIWRNRSRVISDDALRAHAAIVIFLLFVECNLKVTLRQPYPGIAVYFLWGLLLARLNNRTSGG